MGDYVTMTTEELLEKLIDQGIRAYKKNNRSKLWGRKLDRHETVTIDGMDFSCWKELAVYYAGDCIMDNLPNANVEVTLDGNNSTLFVEIDDSEQEKLDHFLTEFFNKVGL